MFSTKWEWHMLVDVIPICEKDNSQTLPFDVSQFRTIFFHKDNDWGLKGLTDSLIQTLKVI